MANIESKSVKSGDYVTFNSMEYGDLKGQVLDVIESKGKRYAIVEPMYLITDRRIPEVLVKVELHNLQRTTSEEIEKRIRRR